MALLLISRLFACHAPVYQRAVRSRGYSFNMYYVTVYGSIWMQFHHFLQNKLPFQTHYSFYFHHQMAPQFP